MNVLATTIPGLFCLFIGVLSIIAFRRLLPDRKAPESDSEDTIEYTAELIVPSSHQFIAKTIGQADMFHVNGCRLLKWRHFDDASVPINENEILMGGDHLLYAGLHLRLRHQRPHRLRHSSDLLLLVLGKVRPVSDNGLAPLYGLLLVTCNSRGRNALRKQGKQRLVS